MSEGDELGCVDWVAASGLPQRATLRLGPEGLLWLCTDPDMTPFLNGRFVDGYSAGPAGYLALAAASLYLGGTLHYFLSVLSRPEPGEVE